MNKAKKPLIVAEIANKKSSADLKLDELKTSLDTQGKNFKISRTLSTQGTVDGIEAGELKIKKQVGVKSSLRQPTTYEVLRRDLVIPLK